MTRGDPVDLLKELVAGSVQQQGDRHSQTQLNRQVDNEEEQRATGALRGKIGRSGAPRSFQTR